MKGFSLVPVLFGVLILPFLHSKDPSDQRAEEKRGRVPHLKKNTIKINGGSHGLWRSRDLQSHSSQLTFKSRLFQGFLHKN